MNDSGAISAVSSELEGPWRHAFDLAWEAFKRRTTPVGAVVVDASERVVARGRNRMRDVPENGEIGGNRLAHSEVNALVKLPIEHRYEDHSIYVTLEPCLLCLGAAWMSTVGTLYFAGRDPYGGCASVLPTNFRAGRITTRIDGPRDDVFGQLAEVLHVAFFVRENAGKSVLAAYQQELPEVVERAKAALDRLVILAERDAPFAEVVNAVGPLLS